MAKLGRCSLYLNAWPTLYPLKWLRFLGYAIYGQEGDLSSLSDGGEPISDYASDIEARSYEFISPGYSIFRVARTFS